MFFACLRTYTHILAWATVNMDKEQITNFELDNINKDD